MPGLPRRHRHQPAGERRYGRILEDHHVGKQKADGTDEVKRLIDTTVVVVAMIVPALRPQSGQKTCHLSLPVRHEVIGPRYGDSMNPR
jgi:hypothetical protein